MRVDQEAAPWVSAIGIGILPAFQTNPSPFRCFRHLLLLRVDQQPPPADGGPLCQFGLRHPGPRLQAVHHQHPQHQRPVAVRADRGLPGPEGSSSLTTTSVSRSTIPGCFSPKLPALSATSPWSKSSRPRTSSPFLSPPVSPVGFPRITRRQRFRDGHSPGHHRHHVWIRLRLSVERITVTIGSIFQWQRRRPPWG